MRNALQFTMWAIAALVLAGCGVGEPVDVQVNEDSVTVWEPGGASFTVPMESIVLHGYENIPTPTPVPTNVPTPTPYPTPAQSATPTPAPVAASSWNDLHDRLWGTDNRSLIDSLLKGWFNEAERDPATDFANCYVSVHSGGWGGCSDDLISLITAQAASRGVDLAAPLGMVQVCRSALGSGCNGTGWVYEDGWIITAAHVLKETEPQVWVITRGGTNYVGQIMGMDKYRDIAAIKLFEPGFFAPLPRREIDSVGADEKLVLIGQSEGLPAEAKVGVLSKSWTIAHAKEDVRGVIDVIQLDLVAVAGDSGGAYVDAFGRVVGIVQGRTLQVGGYALGLPISEIEKVWERLKAGEQLNDDLQGWMHYEFED